MRSPVHYSCVALLCLLFSSPVLGITKRPTLYLKTGQKYSIEPTGFLQDTVKAKVYERGKNVGARTFVNSTIERVVGYPTPDVLLRAMERARYNYARLGSSIKRLETARWTSGVAKAQLRRRVAAGRGAFIIALARARVYQSEHSPLKWSLPQWQKALSIIEKLPASKAYKVFYQQWARATLGPIWDLAHAAALTEEDPDKIERLRKILMTVEGHALWFDSKGRPLRQKATFQEDMNRGRLYKGKAFSAFTKALSAATTDDQRNKAKAALDALNYSRP